VGGYFYSTGVSANSVWVHLYGQNQAQLEMGGWGLGIKQVTQYPWDGKVRLEISPSKTQKFALHLRVPGWCSRWSIKVNQSPVSNLKSLSNGYIAINRTWKPGDVVEFNMAMPVQPVYAHPSVRQLQGRVALQRGPLVYCLEGVDHDGAQLERISVDATMLGGFEAVHRPDLLGGVTVLRGGGHINTEAGWDGLLYRMGKASATKRNRIKLTAIPYYAWDNRAAGEMRVWLRTA
jgi:hypothetical protein